MAAGSYVIGVDFGTDSVRSLILDASNGAEISSSVFMYPRWKAGLYCNPGLNQFRQHPLDYMEGLEATIKECLQEAGKTVASSIRAIGVDTTGSTPVAVDRSGTPLSLLPGFEKNPNAMFVLWKDHTSTKEAAEINDLAATYGTNFLKYVGGIYSSEWFWAKLLHALREDNNVRSSCYSWVEHCDWIPFLLTGGREVSQMKRSICAAGHKALWAKEYGGLPPNDFFSALDPLLNNFTSQLYKQTYTADKPAGHLSQAWAERLGLSTNVIIGVGAFDAHMGAVGGQIEPYYLSKVMGTSTCDMLVAPLNEVKDILVKGICGQVPGSVIPGMMGMEAGQSAFGDTYAWFKNILSWPLINLIPGMPGIDSATANKIHEEMNDKIINLLSAEAGKISPDEENELSVDWLNGRRTPDANQRLTAAITGLSLGTDAPHIFRALVEGTCYGARAIVNRFIEQGIPVRGLIGIGGVARKSSYIMQTMADVIKMPLRIHRSEQTCAAGAAMFAATAAGIYTRVEEAMNAMGQGFDKEYYPQKQNSEIYEKGFLKYRQLGEFIENQLNY